MQHEPFVLIDFYFMQHMTPKKVMHTEGWKTQFSDKQIIFLPFDSQTVVVLLKKNKLLNISDVEYVFPLPFPPPNPTPKDSIFFRDKIFSFSVFINQPKCHDFVVSLWIEVLKKILITE